MFIAARSFRAHLGGMTNLIAMVAALFFATAPLAERAKQHAHDFDYLLGDWEFTADDKDHGKYRGYWSAASLPDGQILDEYRVVGDQGETYYVSTTLRVYNAVLDQWELVSAEPGAGLQNAGTARRDGAEMHIEQKFGYTSEHPSLWRIRYYDIKPDRFSWNGDRSPDGGKTWVPGFLHIEARRTGAARSMEALTHPKPLK